MKNPLFTPARGGQALSLSLVIALGILFSFPSLASAAVDCTNTGVTGVPQIECEALMALYNGTTGSGWTTKTNWDTASAISTWSGVTVSSGHVTVINISNYHLVGSLPAELGNLTSLISLTIKSNSTGLTGSIPSSIGNLTNLLATNLSANALSGSIPTTIGNLTKLTSLNLFGNQLTGAIPTEIGNLTNLTTLYLRSNQLSGSIPTELTNLTKLTSLYLDTNQLSGSIPSGLSSKLVTLWLNSNQLSGALPHDIASMPLTGFKIDTNNFVFSDFESDFSSYCTSSPSSFVYTPQATVDTVRSLVFNNGDTLTITSSITSGSYDLYQWYKDDTIIPGATSRVFTKTADERTDSGVYSYRVTNSVATALTLQSNNITVSIAPNPPVSDNIYYIVVNNGVWVRGSVSPDKDISQYYDLDATDNHNVNYGPNYIISSTTPNNVNSYDSGTLIGGYDDSVAPLQTENVGYIMTNHGLIVPVVTSVGHNKTSADIGSRWSDGSHQFILVEILGNALTFYSIPYGSPWAMSYTVAGALTHVSGATNTGNITVTSQVATQMYPVLKNLTHNILVNGVSEATSSDSTYAGYADYIDIVEEFDLIDPSTLVTTNNPFVWNDATSTWIHVENTFKVSAGKTIFHAVYEVMRPINFNYFGIIQTKPLSSTEHDNLYYYVPKTKPIGGYDFKNTQLLNSAPTTTIAFTSPYIDDLNSPPDRQTMFLKKNAESNYDIGLAFGYSPLSSSTRDCLDYGQGCWWIYTSKKVYPVYVGGTGVTNSGTYDVYAYRQWIDPKMYNINKSAYWNNQDGHDYVYVDYHESVTDDITALPTSYVGKAIRVVESENISLAQTNVPVTGLSLSTTGVNTYGYVVLELYDDNVAPAVSISAPTENSVVSGNSVTLTTNASDDIGLASIQFKIDGVSYGPTSAVSPYSLTWDSTTVSDGPHSLVAVALDTSGNYATSSAVTFTVHNIPTPSHSGGTVQSQITNLLAMGNTELASELQAKYFPASSTDLTTLKAKLALLLAQIKALQDTTPTPTFTFTQDLKLGTKHQEVKLLQQFLNTHGFLVDTTGAGSPGQETTLFGKLTQQALIKFQQANKIKPAKGYFGPITRKVVEKF